MSGIWERLKKFFNRKLPVSCGHCGSVNVLIHRYTRGDHLIDCVDCGAISICNRSP